MVNNTKNEYIPDYVPSPGETLLEVIEDREMSQEELAHQTKLSPKVVNGIINGTAEITPDIAKRLENVFDIPAHFWNNRERRYRQYLSQLDWVNEFPLKKMIDKNWIRDCKEKSKKICELLTFFDITSFEEWNQIWGKIAVDYRQAKTFSINEKAVSAWLRRGEILAEKICCKPYDDEGFRQKLQTIRQLTTEPLEIFQLQLKKLCADVGVAVVFVPQLPKTRVSGATRWLSPDKALIQLSLRYKTDDQLWFTFFHEAGHILLHSENNLFLELEEETVNEKEQEANTFAADILIPKDKLHEFLENTSRCSKKVIKTFAEEIGISPGIVVGRLQHDGLLPHKHCNGLKRKINFS